MLADFHFLRPEWFIAVPVVALILAVFYHRSKQGNGWEKVCDAQLLAFQLTRLKDNTGNGSRWLLWLVPLMFLITIIALVGPSWIKKEQPVFQKDTALVIVLDLSLSMNARDIKPSRLERAKLKIIDILKQKKEGQTALVAYAGDAHTVSPLTVDNKTIISLLPALDSSIMPLSGSHIIDALNTAKNLLVNAGFTQGDILLFTDGIDASQQQKTRQLVKQLKQQGYHTSIIGIGSRAGSPIPIPGQGGFIKDRSGQVILSKLDERPLEKLSQAGGGFYHRLSLDDSDFKEILTHKFVDKDKVKQQEEELEQWVDAGAYVTLLIIPLALLMFRKGILSLAFTLMLLPAFYSQPVEAQADNSTNHPVMNQPANQTESNSADKQSSNWKQTWDTLWWTRDQQAEKAFKQNQYQQAAETFEDPLWKASAYYRAGQYDKALEQYSQFDSADALYNKGNALANLQKLPEAIEAYEEALKLNPELSDAKKNRDYLKKILEQQKQQQNQQQNQNSSDKNKQDKQNQSGDKSQQQDQKGNKQDKQSEQSDQDKQQDNAQNQQGDSNEDQSQSGSEQQNQEQEGQKNKQNQQAGSQDEQNKPENQQEGSEQEQQAKNPQSKEQQEKLDKAKEAMQSAAQQEQAKDQAEQQEQQTAESEQAQKNNEQQARQAQGTQDVMSQLSQEEQQSLKQWLQRIPDDPGQLLRVKFRNNTLLKQRQQNAPEQYEGNPW